jgi:hypothetical protein
LIAFVRFYNGTSPATNEVHMSWTAAQYNACYMEAHASGHEAFWHGRPIWANPFVGVPAREWTAGWKRGAAEFDVLNGGQAPTSDGDRMRLLKRHRPLDVAEMPQRRGRGARTGSAAFAETHPE